MLHIQLIVPNARYGVAESIEDSHSLRCLEVTEPNAFRREDALSSRDVIGWPQGFGHPESMVTVNESRCEERNLLAVGVALIPVSGCGCCFIPLCSTNALDLAVDILRNHG